MRSDLSKWIVGVSLTALAATALTSNAAAQATNAGPAGSQARTPPPAGGGDQTTAGERPVTAGDEAPADELSPENAAQQDTREDIIVTGTSIRGAAPVGSNLISVGRDAIEQTAVQSAQQLLKTVPAIAGLGSAGQGGFGSADASGTNAPSIHGLGASASNSTLILIDGHRLPLSGVNHALGDPNIIPPNAIERVEVLPDGASSVYGSDAVAGVINFITRHRYDGVEVSAQSGFADRYHTYQAGVVAGKTWDTGSALVAYNFSKRDALRVRDRDFLAADHRADAIAAGLDLSTAAALNRANLASFNCDPASVQVGTNIYQYNPATGVYGSPVSNAQANAFCDTTQRNDQIGREQRNNGMIRLEQTVGDRLTLGADFVYSNRRNRSNVSRANGGSAVQATVYGPGSTPPGGAGQINPFFVAPPGTNATSVVVRFSGDDLLGPGAYNRSGEATFYAFGHADYRLTDDWNVTGSAMLGRSDSVSRDVGRISTSAALLALNGTTNQGGSLSTISVPATGLIVTQLPLTTANALDVFRPAGTNRTSAAVLARLTDSTVIQQARQGIEQFTLKVDGSLLPLPAGDIKVAFGGEYLHYTIDQDVIRPLGTGPASSGSSALSLAYDRNVKSAYAELLIPLVSDEMNVPLVRRFDLNIAGRYDDYSDVGSTRNPKIAANWEIVRGLKLRANWARSFVAPALTSSGADAFGTTGETAVAAGPTNVAVPIGAYPGLASIPGIVCSTTTCTIGTTAVQGLQMNGGNPDLVPQKGRTWAVGVDLNPGFVRGLRISATYWHNEIIGGITSPTAGNAVNIAGLQPLLTIFPAGATAAQIAAITAGRPLSTTIPSRVSYVYDFRQRNALNLTAEGIDGEVRYSHKVGPNGIRAGFSGSYKTKYDQQFGDGPVFSVLNTTGFNTTFPSVRFEARAELGLDADLVSATVFLNHTGPYRNWSGNAINPVVSVNGAPTTGGDPVKAQNTVDLHFDLRLPDNGIIPNDSSLYVDVTNLFDRKPAFYNNTQGYDTFTASPFLRVVSVGLRVKL